MEITSYSAKNRDQNIRKKNEKKTIGKWKALKVKYYYTMLI